MFFLILCGFQASICSYKNDCRLKNNRELRLTLAFQGFLYYNKVGRIFDSYPFVADKIN